MINGLPIFAAVVILVAILTVGMILARLYRRSTKEIAYVRTGFGGQKVIMDGGSLVFPVLHEVIAINMNTLRLEVRRAAQGALITKDRMRVDVAAEFYVRVKPTEEAIADSAQTLGHRTLETDRLKELVEGKFVDALRAVAAEMRMEELHEQRVDFVQKVQAAVSEDLLKNGLELESVSLTSLDQTDREFFNPNNAFDAEGLTRLTEEIEARRKKRNDIEQDTEVAVEQKNLEAERQKLEVKRDKEYAVLEQQREVEVRRAQQSAQIAQEQAAQKRHAEEADIAAHQEVEQSRIKADRAIEEQRIEKERSVKESDIARARAIETADIQRQESVSITEQSKQIAVALKSKEESESRAEADRARALAVEAEEAVVTVRDTATADRLKQIELIEARKAAERNAIGITVAAEAEKQAAEDQAEAVKTIAEAKAAESRIEASGESEAEKLRADAAQIRYSVDAEGKRALHEAENLLSQEVITMRVKLALIENLDRIVAESVKPMESIDGIKIVQVDGLNGLNGHAPSGSGSGNAANGNLADQAVAAALRYRGQAPLLDSLMQEIGLDGSSLSGLTAAASEGGNGAADSSSEDSED
ncbi:MAG: flotillin family protein [Myxococcota bacterium]